MTVVYWMGAAAAVATFVFAWSALALASDCDDMQDRIRAEQASRDALARAVDQARQVPSLHERAPVDVPRARECIRCFGPLGDTRNSICTGCWKGAA